MEVLDAIKIYRDVRGAIKEEPLQSFVLEGDMMFVKLPKKMGTYTHLGFVCCATASNAENIGRIYLVEPTRRYATLSECLKTDLFAFANNGTCLHLVNNLLNIFKSELN